MKNSEKYLNEILATYICRSFQALDAKAMGIPIGKYNELKYFDVLKWLDAEYCEDEEYEEVTSETATFETVEVRNDEADEWQCAKFIKKLDDDCFSYITLNQAKDGLAHWQYARIKCKK